jgi:Protein of Unknown function (DUF2784)
VFYRVLADLILVLHAAFILFAVAGGLLALVRRWCLWIHLPAAIWAATVVMMGWICPLTPLEQDLRLAAGQQGYEGNFIEHYLLAAIYPEGLTRSVQVVLGLGVITFNALVYAIVIMRARAARGKTSAAN